MKRFLAVLALVVAGVSTSFAQADLGVGGTQINGGVGFSSYGIPVYVGLDYGVARNITVGGEVSFRSRNDYYISSTGFSIGANGNYHFNKVLQLPSPLDIYAGLSLYYVNWSNDYYDGGVDLCGQIGVRYFLNNNFGLNLEFGGGNLGGGGKFGITYKL